MNYFAILNKDADALSAELYNLNYKPKSWQLQFATLYMNILTEEDYMYIRLKFNIIDPSQAQLEVAKVLYNIHNNSDDSST